MKKLFATTVIMSLAILANAQREFYFGPAYSAGVSTILKSASGMDMNGSSINADLTFTPAFGTGIRLEYFPAWKWGLFFQCGYQQRGAQFKNYMDNYNPRYKFNYCDFNLGAQFRTKGIMENHQLIVQLGINQQYLGSAYRAYDTGDDYIASDVRRYDVGAYIGLGGNIPVMGKDLFQVTVFANQGLTQIFMGDIEMSGIAGRNFLAGLQISYLIGKPKKEQAQ